MSEPTYYETMYILRPTIPEDEVDSHLTKYTEILESAEDNFYLEGNVTDFMWEPFAQRPDKFTINCNPWRKGAEQLVMNFISGLILLLSKAMKKERMPKYLLNWTEL